MKNNNTKLLMSKASYDIYFEPVINIEMEVLNPLHLQDEEKEELLRRAKRELIAQADDKFSEENVSAIELYASDIGSKSERENIKLTLESNSIDYVPHFPDNIICENRMKINGWKKRRTTDPTYREYLKTIRIHDKEHLCRLLDTSLCLDSTETQTIHQTKWTLFVHKYKKENGLTNPIIGSMEISAYSQIERFLDLLFEEHN